MFNYISFQKGLVLVAVEGFFDCVFLKKNLRTSSLMPHIKGIEIEVLSSPKEHKQKLFINDVIKAVTKNITKRTYRKLF